MNSPAISVLMTVFNGGKFLIPAVESILCQTWDDFEFVIVDDASSDGSAEVLSRLASKDRRIRLFCNKENSGQTVCLNQGLREARGRWIARQDADDISMPERLKVQMACVRRLPDLVLLGANGWIIDENETLTGLIHVPLSDAGIRWAMPFQNPFIHTGVVFRRKLPSGKNVRYCEEFRICQDWELWARMVDEGRVANLPERLVCYRDRTDSLSHHFSESTRSECRTIASAAWKKNFPGVDLSEKASTLLESFRGGLRPAQFRTFLHFYSQARRQWIARHPSEAEDRQAEAVHWMQAAGGMFAGGKFPAGEAMLRAMIASPRWTFHVVWDRMFGMGKPPLCISSS